MASIGIMGGTFDPIHYGHLILAEQAWEQLKLDKVIFVTAADPPHKIGQDVTDVVHRQKMTCLAIENNAHFEHSDIEINRDGPSYTVDTLREIIKICGEDTKLYLLLGADEAESFMFWRDPYGIAELAVIAVANRPGCAPVEPLITMPEDMANRIVALDMPGVDISSTDIRDRVNSDRSIRYLLPDSVEKYILGNGLYRGLR